MAPSSSMTVGLEIHARLQIPEKIFCGCPNLYGEPPNTLVCPVCLGLPGSLPVFNQDAAVCGIRAGLAMGCTIHPRSEFDRKNYFYPDLPRNYQITQYRLPLCTGGSLAANGHPVRLRRIHLEEDAGRCLHQRGKPTRIDMNRAGSPLIEIVTEPDLNSGGQALDWLRRLRQLLLFLDVCDGEMATGSLRCDANVGTKQAGVLVEIKNLNSFRAVARAVDFEINRLAVEHTRDNILQPETRLWDDQRQCTVFMRKKEEAQDYRYFPEPDLPPVVVESAVVDLARERLPELPMVRELRLVQQYGISEADSVTLCQNPALAEYFEATCRVAASSEDVDRNCIAATVCAWVLKDVLQICTENNRTMENFPVPATQLADLLALLLRNEVTVGSARKVLQAMVSDPGVVDAAVFVRQQGWGLVTEKETLAQWCGEILTRFPQQVAAYKAGKEELFNFFLGQVMAASNGRACPEQTRLCLVALLEQWPRPF